MWRSALNYTLRTGTNLRNITSKLLIETSPVVYRRGFKTAFALSCAGVTLNSASPVESRPESKLNFLTDVQEACSKNEEALKELMRVLAGCLEEISKEYRLNIEKQIEIIGKCTKLGPVGEHWDELTEYRVHATELKEELTKYETLAQKVGQMAYNQAVTSLLSGVENAMDLVEVEYGKLEGLVILLAKENYQWEAKLLYANRDSILTALK